MTSDREQQVEQLARTAVDKAVAEDRAERRGFTITKFGRHEDGFYHARVTVDGKPIYLHRRWGSWMCPGTINGQSMLKEVEALVIGTSCAGRGKEIKEALQTKVRQIERRERQEDSSAEQTDDPGDRDDAPDVGGSTGGEDQ